MPRASIGWALATVALAVPVAHAQTQVVKPPIARYWMDVATQSMAGMDEMPEMPAIPGLGGLFGGGAGQNSFGNTRGMVPGRWLDLAVATRLKPEGTQATQAIPTGQAMGPSLVLLPPKAEKAVRPPPTVREAPEPREVPEQPKGRLLMYWGCGETVRPGQPKVLDFAKAQFEEYGKFMAGRSDRERGATAEPGHALWPNPQHSQRIPRESSLVGEHAIRGEGLPASLRFTIGSMQDFMPRLAVGVQGGGSAVTRLNWPAMPAARAFFFNAMGGGDNQDMVIWSSSELPEPGWGLLNYASNANIDKWLAEKVLLPASQTSCAIPAGIFAKTQGGMLQGIAYGNELNLVHPPRPTDPKVPWEQEWTARIRVKSATMASLDGDSGRAASRSPSRSAGVVPAANPEPSSEASTDATPNPTATPDHPTQPPTRTLLDVPGLPGVGNVLRGLFGR